MIYSDLEASQKKAQYALIEKITGFVKFRDQITAENASLHLKIAEIEAQNRSLKDELGEARKVEGIARKAEHEMETLRRQNENKRKIFNEKSERNQTEMSHLQAGSVLLDTILNFGIIF
jgi:hypothetical protein